jgi:thiamine pyridinylase
MGAMTKRKTIYAILLILLVLFEGAVGGCSRSSSPTTLNVAIYPYVPRPEQFRAVIEEEWRKVQPNVTINWVNDWDGGYGRDPDKSYDVFVFDAIYLDHFRNNGYLHPLNRDQVDSISDFVDYAIKGVTMEDKVYAIPQLGCGDFLFYWKSDATIADATTISQLTAVLGSCTYYETIPPNNQGLMVNFAGEITDASDYVASFHERINQFPIPLPYDESQIDATTAKDIQTILSMSSFQNALFYDVNAPYQRAAWFGLGYGRAYVGFMESLTQIDNSKLDNIAFKPMPWSDNISGSQHPLFYADVVAIGASTVERGTTQLAIQLANLMTSSDVITKCFKAYGTKGPQYLLPVRKSAYVSLGAIYPLYNDMYSMMQKVDPTLFNLGRDAKSWLNTMKGSMQSMVLADPICYHDTK